MTSAQTVLIVDSGGKRSPATTTTMTSAELRKINKPIVEKRRRERINGCLEDLKNLLMQHSTPEINSKDSNQVIHSKLEKADILEMTVSYLRGIRRKCSANDLMASYREGFSDCAKEVADYLGTAGMMDSINSSKMLCRLSTRLNDVTSISYCSKLQKYVTYRSSSSSSSSSSRVQQLGSSTCLETPMESFTPIKRLAKHRRRLFQSGKVRKAPSAYRTSFVSHSPGGGGAFVSHSPGGVASNKAKRESSSKNVNKSSFSSSAENVRPFSGRTAFDELDINGNRKEEKQIYLAPVDNSNNSGVVWRPW